MKGMNFEVRDEDGNVVNPINSLQDLGRTLVGEVDLGKNGWLTMRVYQYKSGALDVAFECDGEEVIIETFNAQKSDLTPMQVGVQVMRMELAKINRILNNWEEQHGKKNV